VWRFVLMIHVGGERRATMADPAAERREDDARLSFRTFRCYQPV
jgi:hypothetical protein